MVGRCNVWVVCAGLMMPEHTRHDLLPSLGGKPCTPTTLQESFRSGFCGRVQVKGGVVMCRWGCEKGWQYMEGGGVRRGGNTWKVGSM